MKIINADCLLAMKEMPDNSVDAIVTDPPYGLSFMGKKWDYDVPSQEIWEECLRVLKPGGYLLAFAGTRTQHRMAVRIEDAGFEIRDLIMYVYGSGFPKSRNIGKDVEKINVGGLKNLKQIGTKQGIKCETGTKGYSYNKEYVAGKCMGGKQISGEIPVYEINNEWEGWGTALKPAHEPICMARKPLAEKTVAENCLKWGVGGINIDGCRVEGQPPKVTGKGIRSKSWREKEDRLDIETETKNWEQPTGRFPANLIHDNSEEVRECFPETGKGGFPKLTKEFTGQSNITFRGAEEREERINLDSGNASRFFKSIIYQAKASKSERNKGCEGLEEKQKIFNGQSGKSSKDMKGVEQKFTTQPANNNHPTVKPIALMEYLIKMVTPKGGVVLDPFAGSGTTLVAAKQNGFDYIGIELTEEYIPIIEARLSDVKDVQEELFNNQITNLKEK